MIEKKIREHVTPRSGLKVREYRLVVFGGGGVGKSSLICQFLHQEFPNVYVPTVEDSYQHIVQSPDGTCFSLEIMDTSGVYAFPAMRQLNIRLGHAFILVFSLDDVASLEEVKSIREEIVQMKGSEDIPLMLVGNKSDLTSNRRVPPEDAARLAREFGCRYAETSAILNININEMFGQIVSRFLATYVDAQLPENGPRSNAIRRSLEIQRNSTDDSNVFGLPKRGHKFPLGRRKRIATDGCQMRLAASVGCILSIAGKGEKTIPVLRRHASDTTNNNSEKCCLL